MGLAVLKSTNVLTCRSRARSVLIVADALSVGNRNQPAQTPRPDTRFLPLLLRPHPFLSPRQPSLRRRRTFCSRPMRRAGSTRATSPTNTTYSGISNYRTESYRPLRDTPSSQYSNADPRAVARVHFEELSQYLAAYLAKGPSLLPPAVLVSHPRRTRQLPLDCSSKAHKAHAPAVPGAIDRCL